MTGLGVNGEFSVFRGCGLSVCLIISGSNTRRPFRKRKFAEESARFNPPTNRATFPRWNKFAVGNALRGVPCPGPGLSPGERNRAPEIRPLHTFRGCGVPRPEKNGTTARSLQNSGEEESPRLEPRQKSGGGAAALRKARFTPENGRAKKFPTGLPIGPGRLLFLEEAAPQAVRGGWDTTGKEAVPTMEHVPRSVAGPAEQLQKTTSCLAARFVDGPFRDADGRRDLTHAASLQRQPQDLLPPRRERGEQVFHQVVQFGLASLLPGVGHQPLAGVDRLGDAKVPPLAGVPLPLVPHLVEHDRHQERPETFVLAQFEFARARRPRARS